MSPDPFSEFVERAASEFAAMGFPRMPANVIMALTASEDGRLTAAELAERLSVSPAAVSGAIKYLTTLGFVRPMTVQGTRRHIYTLPTERPWYTASLTRPGIYTQLRDVIGTEVARLPESPARDRIAEMADFFRNKGRVRPVTEESAQGRRGGYGTRRVARHIRR